MGLACDFFPLASGSDLGGSLRIPAAYCGVVGLRPSPGVVASADRLLGFSPLPVLGPMARNVADAALLLPALALEQATADVPGLGRPRPDGAAMRTPQPALTSIVTNPPQPV